MAFLNTMRQSGSTGTSIQEVIKRYKGQTLSDRLQNLSADHPNALAKIKQVARGKEQYYFEVPGMKYKL
ncbi:hypothetical protein ACWGNU_08935 [Paenibacillus lautus]